MAVCKINYKIKGPIISKFVAYNFKDILLSMESFKKKNYEQALIETYLKLDECLKNSKVNHFLYNLCYHGFEPEINSKSSSKSVNQPKLTKIRFDRAHINVAIHNSDLNEEEEEADDDLERHQRIADEMGTTANIILFVNNMLFIANCGDSLSVMYKNGVAIKMNQEHKTTLKSEYERIKNCGGTIINNRIEGKLNLTRAIGDLGFKKCPNLKNYEQCVTASPEITKYKSLEGIEFIIMGCDGLWDCVNPQKLCETVSERLQEDVKIPDIISEIFDTILSKTNNSKILYNTL